MHSQVMDTKKMSWARFLVTFLSVMVVLVPVTQAADEKMTAANIPPEVLKRADRVIK